MGAVVTDPDGRLLLILRGREPGAGLWSIPGGKVEPGESLVEATRREVREETALDVLVGDLVGTVERPAPGGDLFVIHDHLVALAPGVDPSGVRAGDDAADVGWFTPSEVRALDCVPGLVDALEGWQILEAIDDRPLTVGRSSAPPTATLLFTSSNRCQRTCSFRRRGWRRFGTRPPS